MEGPKRLKNPSVREPDIDINEEQKQKSIIISNIPKEIQRADLFIYFQKGSNGGGEVNEVIMLEDGKAVVIFDEHKVAERVLTKEHKLNGVLVNLEPYPSTSHDVLPDDIQIFSVVTAELDPSFFKISASELNEHLIEAEKKIHFKFIETCVGFTISGTLEQIDQACLCLSKYATPHCAKNVANVGGKGQKESDLDEQADSHLDGQEESDLEPVILDVEPKLMHILHNKVRSIEKKYKMKIDLKQEKNKVHLSPKGTDGKLFYDGKEEFISLYQKEFQDLEEKDYSLDGIDKDTNVYKMVKVLMDEFNVVIDKREGNWIHIFGNKDQVSRVIQELQTMSGKRKQRRAYKGPVNEELPKPDTYAQRAMSPLSRTLENGVVLSVHQGDITKEHVDVIVNAANEHLDHGGGVAGAIVKQGGRQIQQESDALVRQHGRVPVGQVAWTGPGRLPCKRIFHAVGPQWRVHGEAGCRHLIFNACLKSFNIASQQNICSIAIPGISSGLYGVPVKICAETMFTAAEQFSCEASSNNQLKDIRFVNIDTPTYEAFRKEFYKRYGMRETSSILRSQNTNQVTYPQEKDKGTVNERKFVSNQTNFSNRNGFLVREEHQASTEDSGISRAGVAALKRKEEEEKAKEMEEKKEEEEKEEEEKKKKEMEEKKKKREKGEREREREKREKKEEEEEKKKKREMAEKKKKEKEEKKKETEKKAKASQNNMHQPILKESSNQQSTTPFEGGFNRRQENTERYFEGTKSKDNKYKTNNVFLDQSTTSHEIDDTEEDDDSLSNKLTGMQIGEDPPAKERVGEKTLTNNNNVVTVDSDATLPRKDNSTDNLNNSTIFNNPTGNTSPAVAVNLSGRGLTYETKTDSSQTHNKSLKTVGRGRGALNLAANLSGKPGHAVRDTGIDPTSEPPRNLSVSRNKIPPGLTVTEGGGEEEEEKEDGGNNEEREKGEKKRERDGGKEERRHAVRGTELDLTSEPERNLSDGGNKIPPGLTVTEEGLKLAETNRGERENENISQEKKIKKKHIEVGFAGQEKDEVPSKKFKPDNFTDVMEGLEKENHDKLVNSFGETSEAKDEGNGKEEKESLRTAARSETDRKDRPGGEEKIAEKIPETERNREEKDDQLESSNIDGPELPNNMDGQQTDKEKNSVDLKIDEQKADSKERTGLRKNVDSKILDRSFLKDKKEKHEIPEQVSNNGHPSSETQNEEVPESDIPKKSMKSNEVTKDKSTEQSILERQYSGFNHEGSEKNLDRKNNLDEASLDEPSSMLSNSFEMINMPSVGQENSIKVGENDGSNESSERIENPQSEEGRLSDSADSKEADRKELEMSNFQNDLERAEGTSDDKENLQEPLSTIKNSANSAPETGKSEEAANPVSRNNKHQDCGVCLAKLDERETFKICDFGHVACKNCFDRLVDQGTYVCPTCHIETTCFIPQPPNGQMTSGIIETSLLGHDNFATIFVDYKFPNGIQGQCHPNPDNPYDELHRRTFLPDSQEGREVLELFRKAFDAGLLFTVGKSKINDKDNQIIFNAEIEHKINVKGGISVSGYPDPDYLKRVKAQLKAKGIE